MDGSLAEQYCGHVLSLLRFLFTRGGKMFLSHSLPRVNFNEAFIFFRDDLDSYCINVLSRP